MIVDLELVLGFNKLHTLDGSGLHTRECILHLYAPQQPSAVADMSLQEESIQHQICNDFETVMFCCSYLY